MSDIYKKDVFYSVKLLHNNIFHSECEIRQLQYSFFWVIPQHLKFVIKNRQLQFRRKKQAEEVIESGVARQSTGPVLGLGMHCLHTEVFTYRGADKSLARPTSRCILFDGENIYFDTSLVIYINSTNIPGAWGSVVIKALR